MVVVVWTEVCFHPALLPDALPEEARYFPRETQYLGGEGRATRLRDHEVRRYRTEYD